MTRPKPLTNRQCVVCGAEFLARGRVVINCSYKCRELRTKAKHAQWRADNAELTRLHHKKAYALLKNDPDRWRLRVKEMTIRNRAYRAENPHKAKEFNRRNNISRAARLRTLRELEAKLAQLAEQGITL